MPDPTPTGKMYELLFPQGGAPPIMIGVPYNFFNNCGSNQTSPWHLASMKAPANSESSGSFTISLQAGGNNYGPYTVNVDLATDNILVFYPPIAVTESDTFTVESVTGGFTNLEFDASTDAAMSGWQPTASTVVTLVNLGGTIPRMTLVIGAWMVDGGGNIVAQPLTSDLSAAGVAFTNPPTFAELAFASSFASQGGSSTIGWITITLGFVHVPIHNIWESGLARGSELSASMIRLAAFDVWARGEGPLALTVYGPDKVLSQTPQLLLASGVPATVLTPNPGIMYALKLDFRQIENFSIRFETNTVDAWLELSGFRTYIKSDLYNR